jgi:hypothetical protein
MNENSIPGVSLYEKRKPRRLRPALTFILLLVVFLLVIHFLNLFLHWTVIRLELVRGPVFKAPEYSFLGFSSFNQNEIAAIRYFKNSSRPIRIFGFFDFYHPAVFAIWNKNDMTFIDLGPIVTAVPAGFSRVSFFQGSVFLLEHENMMTLKCFNDAILGRAWTDFLSKKIMGRKSSAGQVPGSFVVKSLETSRYLKIPYLLYFFLPLLLIGAAVIRFGAGMLSAFLYYVEMFFLFDYQNLFVKVPFGWIFKYFNFEISEASCRFIAAVLVIIFTSSAIFGFWHWKKHETPAWQKRILLIFVLLPLVLFL